MSYSELGEIDVEKAQLLSGRPAFLAPRRVRGAKLQGLSYERKAQEHLEQRFGELYLRSPWLMYKLRNERHFRFCQPDGLYFNFPQLYIGVIEIKLKHTAEAFWQINNLYRPVIRKIFTPHLGIRAIEVCRWYDAVDFFPTTPAMVNDLELFPRTAFGVHIWKP